MNNIEKNNLLLAVWLEVYKCTAHISGHDKAIKAATTGVSSFIASVKAAGSWE